MKKTWALLLALVLVLSLPACGSNNPGQTSGADTETSGADTENVAMRYMTADETLAVLGTAGYTLVDLRAAADYEQARIPSSVSIPMDAAVNGDTAAGEAAMKSGTEGLGDTLILICYSGKAYAQAGTNALSAIGYDMSKVFTLEGGFNNWKEVNPEQVEEAVQIVAPEKDIEMQYITAEDALAVLDTDGYTFLDVRKADDYNDAHITGAVSADMDAAKNGDFDAGVAAMQAATKDLDGNLVIVCYSGKAYAQAATNVLSAIGYDMSRVFTLEGGFNNWKEVNPDAID